MVGWVLQSPWTPPRALSTWGDGVLLRQPPRGIRSQVPSQPCCQQGQIGPGVGQVSSPGAVGVAACFAGRSSGGAEPKERICSEVNQAASVRDSESAVLGPIDPHPAPLGLLGGGCGLDLGAPASLPCSSGFSWWVWGEALPHQNRCCRYTPGHSIGLEPGPHKRPPQMCHWPSSGLSKQRPKAWLGSPVAPLPCSSLHQP